MEKSGMPLDNSLNYAEGRNATPSAPPAYDEAMASAYAVHNSMVYEHTGNTIGGPEVHNSMVYEHTGRTVSGPTPVNQTIQQAAAYPQQQPLPVAIVPSAVPGIPLPVGPRPIKTACTTCNKHIRSRISRKNSTCSKFLLCTFLALTVCCLPCACLPFCLCGPERVSHFCPKCNAHLGTWVNH